MKTILAYVLGFSVTFTVIAGGMYVLSEKYPWMFGSSQAQENSGGKLKATVSVPAGIVSTDAAGDSSQGPNETIATLKTMLAEKNDSLAVKTDSIQQLNTAMAQLQKKNSDANSVIAQLQSQVDSWKSQRRKDLASAYNDMAPSVAAKIMNNLNDKDIIFILSSVQKKQAAQILGQLDPARAAKLMTSLGQNK